MFVVVQKSLDQEESDAERMERLYEILEFDWGVVLGGTSRHTMLADGASEYL